MVCSISSSSDAAPTVRSISVTSASEGPMWRSTNRSGCSSETAMRHHCLQPPDRFFQDGFARGRDRVRDRPTRVESPRSPGFQGPFGLHPSGSRLGVRGGSMSRYRFTSESVTEGHPDKICDQVSDAILDAILTQDRRSRVACESLAKTGMIVVAGEITTSARLDFPQIVRETVADIGYDDSAKGFDAGTCAVLVAIERQSPGIAQGVNEGDGLHKEQGAGDQGLMFGYATDETPELMPAPIQYAHTLARQLAAIRKKKLVDFLRPDGKTQITLEYENDVPVRIDAIVVSTQHDEKVKYKQLREAIVELVIDKALPKRLIDK